ncbi:hypothetical protein [Sinorhizobium meliloti]|uniref:hypothetical protein n=1 Tax=Rhizobium meliloti TaxID=382 RepID=UPI00299D30B3|nr:hypothetical protein [Sinorhizobium meliloti]
MPRVSAPVYSLNGGEVGDEALSRLDLERLQFAGSLYSNLLPRVIGSMTLRPGLEYITDIDFGDVELLEYNYSGGSALIPILSNLEMRVVKDEALVTRASVSTTIQNGAFDSFVGWTDASTGSASATVSSGDLVLTGTTQDRASAKQTISVALADQGVEHAVRFNVERGPLKVRLGSTTGDDDLINESVLDDGIHSIAFTPTTSNIYIELFNDQAREVRVISCVIDTAGVMVIPTPWTSDDLADNIVRYRQNKDVLYVASGVYQQREIQRRGDTSWGVQRYKVDDGPFVTSDGTISLDPSVFTGNGTLTASRGYFEAGMIGRLFRLFQSGQTVNESFTSDPAEGAHIRVSGVGSARTFAWSISGTWSGTVTLQVATDDGSGNPGAWTDLFSRTSNDSGNYTDGDDNVVKFFRFQVGSGEHTSGTMVTSLVYSGGSQTGVLRVTAYTSPTSVDVEVLTRLFSLNATFEWDHSVWSDFDGWPAAVDVFGGRIYWSLSDMIYGSVPDAFKSFDDEVEGNSAPISRSINASSQRGILWLLGLQRLIAGTDASEVSIKASSFDEPLTGDSWFPVDASTRGCANLRAVKADKDGIFVQASGTGAFRMAPDQSGFDYSSSDLMAMHEEICDGSPIVDVAVQRKPDTVVWFILANGEARALTYEPAENVIAWSRVVTDGLFKAVAAVRGAGQDSVYFAVLRNGAQRLERLAKLSECRGGAINCLADGFKRFTGAATTTFSVPHLNGKQVMVWSNGEAIHNQENLYTVTGNQVVLATAKTNVVIGLPYTGKWQSTKLAYGAANGSALFHKKRVSQLGLGLTKTMLDGLRVGNSFTNLKRLTMTKGDKPIPAGYLFDNFDADMMSISSDWDTDSRICLEARAPYPFTASSLVMDVKTNG